MRHCLRHRVWNPPQRLGKYLGGYPTASCALQRLCTASCSKGYLGYTFVNGTRVPESLRSLSLDYQGLSGVNSNILKHTACKTEPPSPSLNNTTKDTRQRFISRNTINGGSQKEQRGRQGRSICTRSNWRGNSQTVTNLCWVYLITALTNVLPCAWWGFSKGTRKAVSVGTQRKSCLYPRWITVIFPRVQMPYSHMGILAEKSNNYVKVSSKLGMTFLWNEEDALLVRKHPKRGRKPLFLKYSAYIFVVLISQASISFWICVHF